MNPIKNIVENELMNQQVDEDKIENNQTNQQVSDILNTYKDLEVLDSIYLEDKLFCKTEKGYQTENGDIYEYTISSGEKRIITEFYELSGNSDHFLGTRIRNRCGKEIKMLVKIGTDEKKYGIVNDIKSTSFNGINYILLINNNNPNGYLLDMETGNPINFGEITVSKIGKEVLVFDDIYFEVENEIGNKFLINKKTLLPLSLEGIHISKLGNDIKIGGIDFIEGKDESSTPIYINKETKKVLRVNNQNIKKVKDENIKVGDKLYTRVISTDELIYLIEHATLNPFKLRGEYIHEIGEDITLFNHNFVKIKLPFSKTYRLYDKDLKKHLKYSCEDKNGNFFGETVTIGEHKLIETFQLGCRLIDIKTLEPISDTYCSIDSLGSEITLGNIKCIRLNKENLTYYSLETLKPINKTISDDLHYKIRNVSENNLIKKYFREINIGNNKFIHEQIEGYPNNLYHFDTLDPIIINNRNIVKIGEEVTLGDYRYTEVFDSENKKYLISNETLELFKIDSNDIVKIGEEVTLGDYRYTEVFDSENTNYYLDNLSLKYLKLKGVKLKRIMYAKKIENNIYIKYEDQEGNISLVNQATNEILVVEGLNIIEILEPITFNDKKYIKVLTSQGERLLDNSDGQILYINGQSIENIGKKQVIGNLQYKVLVFNNGEYIYDIKEENILSIDNIKVEKIGRQLTLFTGTFIEIMDVNNNYKVISAENLKKIVVDGIAISSILEEYNFGDYSCYKIKDSQGVIYIIDIENNIVIKNSSNGYLKDIKKLGNNSYIFSYSNQNILVDKNGNAIIVDNVKCLIENENIFNRNLLNVVTEIGDKYIINLITNSIIKTGDGGILKSINKVLPNGDLVCSTTKNQIITLDSKYNIMNDISDIYIESNLDKESEYIVCGVRIKNVEYSDGTYGIVNSMTLKPVVIKLKNKDNKLLGIEEGDNSSTLFVTLDNEEEIEVNINNLELLDNGVQK